MFSNGDKSGRLDVDEILDLVNSSAFFDTTSQKKINSTFFRGISIREICLPARLKYCAGRQNINSLEGLLNYRSDLLTRFRNLGIKTIVDSQKNIIDYIIAVKINFQNDFSADCLQKIVIRYYPLLEGDYRTTRFHYNMVYNNLKCIYVPKAIREYIQAKNYGVRIIDLLDISFTELYNSPRIGIQTIHKIQMNLVNLLNLKKIIFLEP